MRLLSLHWLEVLLLTPRRDGPSGAAGTREKPPPDGLKEGRSTWSSPQHPLAPWSVRPWGLASLGDARGERRCHETE